MSFFHFLTSNHPNILIPTALSFHEDFPPQLVKLQDDNWKPLIAWVSETYNVRVDIYDGILGTKQPDATILKLGSIVSGYDQFKLAGASPPPPPSPLTLDHPFAFASAG